MPVFSKKNSLVLFIHVPKAAGTSIETAFVSSGYEMSFRRGGVFGPLNEFDRENKCSPQHMHAELLEKHFSYTEFLKVFCVVRHPITRFISEYRFRVQSKNPVIKGSINDFAKDALELYRENPMVLDNHIRPQVDFIWRNCFTYRLEDGFENILAEVSEGLPDPVLGEAKRAMRSNRNIRADLAADSEALIRKFYATDFEKFGYE